MKTKKFRSLFISRFSFSKTNCYSAINDSIETRSSFDVLRKIQRSVLTIKVIKLFFNEYYVYLA